MPDINDFCNNQVRNLPGHLKKYIVDQNYHHYTSADHAVWRYVMRQNYIHLKDIAYYPYIPGLTKAGLTIEKIPSLEEMNNALAKIGWGAVTVDGFIPPAAFMEFQAYRVLVIAADIRQLNHIEYTPAPDIIHESAGHAPIIAEPEYNQYLSYFGSIGAKAMFSSKDFELYEAIRELSILKESPDAGTKEVIEAEKKVAFSQENLGEPSEMALLSRLHWWTVEYGLIGTLQDHKIYGAGLLSSIGESVSCMQPDVEKIWYTLDAVNYSYDITKPQPQLFVTNNFQNLINVLEEFADTMAFRKGGISGMLKAIECKNTATVVYSSGLQVSGIFTNIYADEDIITFINASGPVSLSYGNKELNGHGKNYHSEGFSSPVGNLKGYDKALEDFDADDLLTAGIIENNHSILLFASGIRVEGTVTGIIRPEQKIILISFNNCMVTGHDGSIYFEPGWGVYDMAIGKKVSSVFCGAADKDAYEHNMPLPKGIITLPEYDNAIKNYHHLFQSVRVIREDQEDYKKLPAIWQELINNYPKDWLCSLEILEMLQQQAIMPELAVQIQTMLELNAVNNPDDSRVIRNGLALIHSK